MKSLEELFGECSDVKFLFVQPGGNWGDYLIYFGAEILARRLGIEFETVTIQEFLQRAPEDSNIYIHGGGGFNEWCSGATFECLSHAVKNYQRNVIYGPCTTSENVDFLNKKFNYCLSDIECKRLVLFAREQVTYDCLQRVDSISSACEIHIDHDTALHLTKKDLVNIAGPESDSYCLYGYRLDNEASNVKNVPDCLRVIVDPPTYAKSFEQWIRLHAKASRIITNRTHSSIAGAILGKDTTLFASKYHKNHSIWEYSLASRGVQWADDNVATNIATRNWFSKLLPTKFHQSHKVQKFAKRVMKVPVS